MSNEILDATLGLLGTAILVDVVEKTLGKKKEDILEIKEKKGSFW